MIKAIFIDRDGVINEYPGDYKYVTSWGEFHFLPKVKSVLKKLSDKDYKIFIISNQAGVSKGLFAQEALDNITRNMLNEIGQAGGHIEAVLYCVHTNEDNCSCRKPKIGLVEEALNILSKKVSENENKRKSDYFFVGDTIRDIQTGKNAGCRTLLVFSGKEKPQNKDSWEVQPDYTAEDLSEAVELIFTISKDVS